MPLPQLLDDSDGVGATDASNGNSKYEALATSSGNVTH